MSNPFVAKSMADIPELPEASVKFLESGSKQGALESISWTVQKDTKTGSVVTDDRLRVKLEAKGTDKGGSHAILKDVYALGDCAILEGNVYPATAQVASQKADWLAKRLNKGDIEQARFEWKNLGVMAYIGNWNALFQGGGGMGNISGRAAWVIWRGAYLTKSVSWRNKILIPTYW
jgi:NADH dehydrogenase FAD-containing subunit